MILKKNINELILEKSSFNWKCPFQNLGNHYSNHHQLNRPIDQILELSTKKEFKKKVINHRIIELNFKDKQLMMG